MRCARWLFVSWIFGACGPASAPGIAAPPASATGNPHSAASAAAEPSRRALHLARSLILVDGHVDLPFRLHTGKVNGQVSEDISSRTPTGDFDYPRAVAGGLNAPFQSIYIPSRYQQSGGAKQLADDLIDSVEALTRSYPEKFALAPTPSAVRANFAASRVSLPLGIENGAAIEGDLKNLAHFRDRGVSYMTLTHATDNALSDSSYATTHTHGGLSSLGKAAIAEMNRVGILVDISHVSDASFVQAIELSKTPVIASHSSLRYFVPGFERNVSDDMLHALAQAGGVILINFGSAFLLPEPNARSEERHQLAEQYAVESDLSLDHPAQRRIVMTYVDSQLPMLHASVSDVADHIDRVVQRVGIAHVGLGSDFDGVGDSLPTGLEDVSKYPNLLDELLQRGYSEQDLQKLCSENILRVWQQALDFAEKSAISP